MVLGTLTEGNFGVHQTLLLLVTLGLGADCSDSRPAEPSPRTSLQQSVASSQPAAPAEKLLDRTEIGDISLQLWSRGDACFVRTREKEIPLAPTAPCFFLRHGERIQQFSYADRKLDFVVIIAGGIIEANRRKNWKIQEGEICGEKAQALIGTKSGIRSTKHIHNGGIYCKSIGVDEKEFWAFGHDED